LIQLANLNEKASAVVGFVIATPLVLLLAIGGLQISWLLILQNQLDRAVDIGARSLSLYQSRITPEVAIAEYLAAAPFEISNYKVEVYQKNIERELFQTVSIEVPVKIWIGPEFILKAISNVP
jgi:Flp pilus assembly protein TadG